MKLFAGFGRRHLLLALGFCVVVQLTHSTYVLVGKEEFEAIPVAAWTIMYFGLFLIGLCCAVAAENLLGPSVKSIAVAIVAAAITTTAAVEAVLYALPEPVAAAVEGKERGAFAGDLHRIAYRFAVAAGWSLLLIVFYSMLQASRRATKELHAMRVAALDAERKLLEGDLRAMQGRVDPELLFDTLLEIDQAYARDVQAGQDGLDALIRFLRAALPADPAASSTLAGEQELAEAYLALFPREAGPKVAISVAPEASALAMPAMLLLPLVRWALGGRSATRLEIRAQRRDAALEVSVRSDSRGAAGATDADIAGVRERLMRLFAGHASLDVSVTADARQVRLSIPTL
jgi:hypothetical protein